eukprot:115047_1
MALVLMALEPWQSCLLPPHELNNMQAVCRCFSSVCVQSRAYAVSLKVYDKWLEHWPTQDLHTLNLNLRGNGIGADGARALAELKQCPALQSLNLDLDDNGIGADGARALAELKQCPALVPGFAKSQPQPVE